MDNFDVVCNIFSYMDICENRGLKLVSTIFEEAIQSQFRQVVKLGIYFREFELKEVKVKVKPDFTYEYFEYRDSNMKKLSVGKSTSQGQRLVIFKNLLQTFTNLQSISIEKICYGDDLSEYIKHLGLFSKKLISFSYAQRHAISIDAKDMEVLVKSLKHLEKIEFNCRDEKTLELLTDLNLKSLKTHFNGDSLCGDCFDNFKNLEELELNIDWDQVDLLHLLQRLDEGGNSETLKSVAIKGETWGIAMNGEIWEGNDEHVLDAEEFICKNFGNLEKLEFPYFHEEIRNLTKLSILKFSPDSYIADSVDAGDVGKFINLKQMKEVELNIRTFEDLAKIFVLMLTFKVERFSLQEDLCVVGRYSHENNSIDLKFKYPIPSEKLKELVRV